LLIAVSEVGPEGLEVDRTLRLGPLAEADGGTLDAEEVRIRGTVRPLRSDLGFRGRVGTAVRLSCGRCLEPYRLELDLPFDLIYQAPPPPEENEPRPGGPRELEDPDPQIAFLDDGRIDLRHLAEEQAYLALPLKPLCREECRGLCPQCGAQWNREDCGCETDTVDPRLKVLEKLKQDLESK